MPRKRRVCPPGVSQHLIQRGNNRQICFASSEDFAYYAHWLREAAEGCAVSVHAWVLMTNHVHLLVTPEQEGGISRMMQQLGRRYVRYFNDRYGRSGTLWEGRFKACLVQDGDYLLQCYRYIELNPVRAGMVTDPADYRWSSYRVNALGAESRLCTPHPEYQALGDGEARRASYRRLCDSQVDGQRFGEIRHATEHGVVFGNDRFRAEMEALTGARLRPRRRGRPPSSKERAVASINRL